MQNSHRTSDTPPRSSFREVLSGYPTGIAVVAALVEGRIVGLSANSFTSVSLDPPLVSVSFAHSSTSRPLLRRAPRWGISVLGEDQDEMLRELRRPAEERFSRLDMAVEGSAAFVRGSLAHLAVEPESEVDAGDHVLTLLRVLDHVRDDEQRPLVFFDSLTHQLSR